MLGVVRYRSFAVNYQIYFYLNVGHPKKWDLLFFFLWRFSAHKKDWYVGAISTPSYSPKSILLAIPACVFLIFSTCFTSIFPSEDETIGSALMETFAFHCSHYYILISTEILVSFSGLIPANSFCRPLKILIPFEMYEVGII